MITVSEESMLTKQWSQVGGQRDSSKTKGRRRLIAKTGGEGREGYRNAISKIDEIVII